ncbi:hypothetical protein Lal_00023285 [Lupinus albus]|nr:hypothetical protein Lal_00023285 [Lupinus albus]
MDNIVIVKALMPYEPLLQGIKTLGHKHLLYVIGIFTIKSIFVTIEYDPNRNTYICLILRDREKIYILRAIIRDTIVSNTKVPIKMRNNLL